MSGGRSGGLSGSARRKLHSVTPPVGVLVGALLGLALLVVRGQPPPGVRRLSALVGQGPRHAAVGQVRPPGAHRVPEAVAAGSGLILSGPVLGVLAVLAVLAGRLLRRRRAASGARSLERARAVEALSALAVELRAGRPSEQALAAAAEVATGPFRQVLMAGRSAASVGIDVPTALLAGLDNPGCVGCPGGAAVAAAGTGGCTAVPEAVRGLAACWQVCSRTGSSLAPAVERLADGLRDRQAQQQAVAAELAGPQATAAVLAVLPLGGVALAASLGADPLHVLLRTPLGLGCLVLGLLLDGLGLWWTARLVARAAAA